MSGIIAVLNLDGAPVEPDLLRRLTAAMAFLGPDGTATWSRGPIGMGFAAQHTHDRSPQPATLDGRYWIVADARVDGRDDLCHKLEEDGRQPVEDTELLLRAYRRWGRNCVAHLIGDFAFLVWDGESLFAAADPLGVRRLYWAQVGCTLAVSNSFAAVAAWSELSREPDQHAVADYLQHMFPLDEDATFFRAVRALRPGHRLMAGRDGVTIERYWAPPPPSAPRPRRDEEWVEGFREHLNVAVRDRIRTGTVAILMSGGIDSTSVAAVAHAAGANVGAATAIHSPLVPDDAELRHAEASAQYLGIKLDLVRGDTSPLLAGLDEATVLPPWPLWHPCPAFDAQLTRTLASHACDVLTGLDGDVVFGLHSLTARLLENADPFSAADELGNFALHARGRVPFGRVLRSWRSRRAASEPEPIDLLAPSFRRAGDPARLRTAPPPEWPLDHVPWFAGMQWYAPRPEAPLAYSHPLADIRLVQFCRVLPAVPWRVQKMILRRAVAGMLPKSVLDRPKTPLPGDPVAELFRRDGLPPLTPAGLHPLLRELLDWDAVTAAQRERSSSAAYPLIRIHLAQHWLAQAAAH